MTETRTVDDQLNSIAWWQRKIQALNEPCEMAAPDGWPAQPPKKMYLGPKQDPLTARRYTEDEERALHQRQDGYISHGNTPRETTSLVGLLLNGDDVVVDSIPGRRDVNP